MGYSRCEAGAPCVLQANGASLLAAEVEACEEVQTARMILTRFIRPQGVIGLPIRTGGGGAGAEHWALLVQRRHAPKGDAGEVLRPLRFMSPLQLVDGALHLGGSISMSLLYVWLVPNRVGVCGGDQCVVLLRLVCDE